ncbi:uncharacterized protein LOC119901297 [Micropterus salmoides]|uniref:uncharacterized protein LOC119901297 n=1 Tax=Micropterus salmoides TaxID=27706 RepID=UPI0018EA419E|nr:uncharacterized protein LOC119901297 [Micropterus salmoides]
MSYNRYPVGLQGWQDTEPFLKQLEQSTAAMSASSHRAALMVSATETGNCFHPSSCRLCVTIRAASLTPTWAGLGRSTTPECSATAHCTGIHSTLLQGISSLQTEGTRASNTHSPFITPYKRPIQGVGTQRFNSHHSRARSIIERAFGMMKTRFRAIFLQALEVHHTFVPHVITACAILHNICLGAGDIVAPEDEPEEDVGENGLETVSGAPWRDQLSAEVSALEEVPPDHQYF